jgi:hypothetical protein
MLDKTVMELDPFGVRPSRDASEHPAVTPLTRFGVKRKGIWGSGALQWMPEEDA